MGDRVTVNPSGGGEGVIEEVLPRQNRLGRPPVANVEQLLVLFSMALPPVNLLLLDRILVLAESNFLATFLCFNKLDLVGEGETRELKRTYGPAGYQVIFTSALTGEGVGKVKEQLKGKVTVVAGPSGSGKSTLLNAVQGGLKLKVGPVSRKTGRGKQTTRHVELISLETRGMVADSPGFSQLEIDGIAKEDLGLLFPEMSRARDKCRFTRCLHENEPSCGVKGAVAAGEIAPSRYESYLVFLREAREKERSY